MSERPNTAASHDSRPATAITQEAQLLSLCEEGNASAIDEILGTGTVSADIVDADGYSALILGACYGHAEVVSVLLKAKANVNMAAPDGCTALQVAVQGGFTDVVIDLLASNPDVNAAAASGATAAFIAAQEGFATIISLLARAKASMEVKCEGVTAICIAAQEGHVECVESLLAAEADPTATTELGSNPLHLACGGGHVAVVDLLLKQPQNKVDLEALGGLDQRTALVHSIYIGHIDIVEMLILAGADLSNKSGTCPAHAALECGDVDALQMLIDAKVDLETTNANGDSCVALLQQDTELASLLTLEDVPEVYTAVWGTEPEAEPAEYGEVEGEEVEEGGDLQPIATGQVDGDDDGDAKGGGIPVGTKIEMGSKADPDGDGDGEVGTDIEPSTDSNDESQADVSESVELNPHPESSPRKAGAQIPEKVAVKTHTASSKSSRGSSGSSSKSNAKRNVTANQKPTKHKAHAQSGAATTSSKANVKKGTPAPIDMGKVDGDAYDVALIPSRGFRGRKLPAAVRAALSPKTTMHPLYESLCGDGNGVGLQGIMCALSLLKAEPHHRHRHHHHHHHQKTGVSKAVISRTQKLRKSATKALEKFDLDGDGFLNAAEFSVFASRVSRRRRSAMGKHSASALNLTGKKKRKGVHLLKAGVYNDLLIYTVSELASAAATEASTRRRQKLQKLLSTVRENAGSNLDTLVTRKVARLLEGSQRTRKGIDGHTGINVEHIMPIAMRFTHTALKSLHQFGLTKPSFQELKEDLMHLDTNSDGVLSLEEFEPFVRSCVVFEMISKAHRKLSKMKQKKSSEHKSSPTDNTDVPAKLLDTKKKKKHKKKSDGRSAVHTKASDIVSMYGHRQAPNHNQITVFTGKDGTSLPKLHSNYTPR